MINNLEIPISEYGTERLGRLKKVLLHNPVISIKKVSNANIRYYLFNKLPDANKYVKEHNRYSNLLKSLGVEVYELSDYITENIPLMTGLPNLAYLHDISAITNRGAILSRMCPGGREHEEIVVKEALTKLGIPIYHEFKPFDYFESCLFLSPETILIANTERHCKKTINSFIPKALEIFKEVIYVEVPKLRRYMHADMIYGRISDKLALVYTPAFLKTYLITKDNKMRIDFKSFMADRNVELIDVSNKEQQHFGCSFVVIEPNVFIHYDFALSVRTQEILKSRGVDIVKFHPKAILAGGGSLKCLTLRLLREH